MTARVDPDEPWRYVCPVCGSVQVRVCRNMTTEDGIYCDACHASGFDPIDRRGEGSA